MVVICAPSAWTASRVQDFTARPFRSIVQAPHWLVSQPTWVPVRPASSLMKCTRSIRGSTSWELLTPLIVIVTLVFRSDLLRGVDA